MAHDQGGGHLSADRAAVIVVDLVKRELGVDVSADGLRRLIVERWATLSRCAHVIHSRHAAKSAEAERPYDPWQR